MKKKEVCRGKVEGHKAGEEASKETRGAGVDLNATQVLTFSSFLLPRPHVPRIRVARVDLNATRVLISPSLGSRLLGRPSYPLSSLLTVTLLSLLS
jgi:hypothetical protein